MFVRANPRVPLLWADAYTLQLGDAPSSPQCRITDAEAEVVESIRRGLDTDTLMDLAAQAGVSESRARRLLAFLRPGLIARDALSTTGSCPELSDASYAYHAEALRRRRSGHVVEVRGNREHIGIVRWLAEHTGVRVPEPGTPPTQQRLGILISGASPHPHRYADWMFSRIPHVAVLLGAHGVEVTPVLRPGASPCLRCRELWQAHEHPSWPMVAAQLSARAPSPVERTVLATALSLAVSTLLSVADGAPEAHPHQRHRVHPYGVAALPNTRFHPDCGCQTFDRWSPSALSVTAPT